MRKKREKEGIEEGKWKERGEAIERKRGIKRRYGGGKMEGKRRDN